MCVFVSVSYERKCTSFITTHKATYLPHLSSVWVASKLATALPDVLRTAVKRAGCGDTQQQQQLNRKVSVESPEVLGVMERCKSNVSRPPCFVQLVRKLGAGLRDALQAAGMLPERGGKEQQQQLGLAGQAQRCAQRISRREGWWRKPPMSPPLHLRTAATK